MEINQQNGSARNTSTTDASTSFSNQQPGQQLPAANEPENSKRSAESNDNKEEHSESSKPENENQTLGTP